MNKNLSTQVYFYIILAATLAALIVLYSDGLALMVRWWERDEYSHGYMIPLVAMFLLWQRLPRLEGTGAGPSWSGPLLMLLALLSLALGELSALYTIVQYAFLLAVYALIVTIIGWRGLKTLWAPLLYLVFMIPLPNFLYNNLSQQLQLLSSSIGVEVIRLLDISVFLQGNVIDLGTYQLQVVEACSGLNYLFPLMSFGFLIACIYQGPNWHKWLIFLSTIPITVLMNSFRIAVIGATVKYWGIEMAEGFLHDFEGWAVFMACLAVLAIEIGLLNLFSRSGRSWLDMLDLSLPSKTLVSAALPAKLFNSLAPLATSLFLTLLALPIQANLVDRDEFVPARESFAVFPLIFRDWYGRENTIDAEIVDALHLSDYITADYRRGIDDSPINLYVAYYQSQRKGSSIHSPRSCIPGGGWVIADHRLTSVSGIPGKQDLKVNMLVIENAGARLLVYYWFDQRGRVLTNEYLAKWFLFYDSLTLQRTDGALVRLTTEIPNGQDISQAEERLRDFTRDFYPLLQRHVPR